MLLMPVVRTNAGPRNANEGFDRAAASATERLRIHIDIVPTVSS